MNRQNHHHFWLKKNTAVLLLGAAVLLLFAGGFLLMSGSNGEEVPSQQVGGTDTVRVRDGAELLQTLTYSRCSHTVTRRVTAPVEVYGKTLEEVQSLYPEWKITSFSSSEVQMSQRPELFCPAHLVLMTGPDGKLCVFRNKYGDALALEKELSTDVSLLPAAVQEELSEGIGFSTDEELSGWLESVES
ncbi:MAG: hypothetical protein J6K73_03860 [Clostridia bacterium]|nr:hypothetical protein [Clostridia bacterium]MBP3648901.1 hypothetical protein [Clostridia bacterium]